MKKNLLVTLLIAILAMSILSGCGGDSKKAETPAPAKTESTKTEAPKAEAPKADEKKEFVVAMEAGYPPYNWSQIDNKNGAVPIEGTKEFAGGYDVEFAKIIAEKLGRKLVIKKIEWDGLIPAINSGMADAIIAGMTPTAERKQAVDFTDLYNDGAYVLVVLKDGKYANAKTLNDFAGAKITGQLNTTHYDLVDQLVGAQKQVAGADFPSMRLSLQTNIIDGYVSEKPEALSACKASDKFKMIELEQSFKLTEDAGLAIALKKGSPLKDEINKILAEISKEKRDKIMLKAIDDQANAIK